MEKRDRIIELLTAVRYTTNNIDKVADEICLLFDVAGRSEQFKCDCGGTNHYKNEMHDSVMCADCGTVYARI